MVLTYGGRKAVASTHRYNMTASLNMDSLRALRLWHWEQHQQLTKRMSHSPLDKDDIKHFEEYRKLSAYASVHMRAVQLLNDMFSPADTAEKDFEIYNKLGEFANGTRT